MMHIRSTFVAFSFGILLLSDSVLAADKPFNAPLIVKASVQALEQFHVTQKPLDDALSRRWLRVFLNRLDPNRLYFVKSDLEEFRAFENRLDDFAKEGDFQFPLLVRERYRARVSAAASIAIDYVFAKHNYALDKEVPIRFESYARDATELRNRWRLHLKREMLVEQMHGRQLSNIENQLAGRYLRIVQQAAEMPDERLCTIYLESLGAIYDPHSTYYDEAYLIQFNNSGPIRRLTTGFYLRPHRGRFLITTVDLSIRDQTTQELIGWELYAITLLDGATLDLVEMDVSDFVKMFCDGPLEQENEYILELSHPATRERKTISWVRLSEYR